MPKGVGGGLLAHSFLMSESPRTLSLDLSFRLGSGPPPLDMNVLTLVPSLCDYVCSFN